MGTKLLSNGLDCKSVQFICLVDCSIDCVDYLQMVGRIRHWGFVKCLAVQRKRVFPPDTEIGRRFPTINWRHCVSESVARFYDVPFEGHSGCCGFKKRDDRIEDLKKNLKKGAIQILNMVGGNKDVIVIEDREDVNVIPLDPLTQKVHKLLRVSGSDVLRKEWIQILGEYEWEPTKTLLTNIEPRNIVSRDDTLSSKLCADCLMPLHGVDACGVTAKVVGGLLYELLATFKITGDKMSYDHIKKKIPLNGASLFLITAVEVNIKRIRPNFIAMNKANLKMPTIAEDKAKSVLDPVGTFKKYFNLIWKQHINVMLLIFNGDVDHCAESFSKMSEYYSNVFNNSRNIQKIINNNGTAIFAIYKRHAMADLEAWYVSKVTTTADKSLLTEFIGNMNNIPIAVIMIWAMFESRK